MVDREPRQAASSMGQKAGGAVLGLDRFLHLATFALVAYIAFVLIFGSPFRATSAADTQSTLVGTRLPSDLIENGPEIVAVLTPTCEFCMRSAAAWNELLDAGVVIVGVSPVDPAPFVSATGARFPILEMDPETVDELRALGVRSVPYTFLIGTDGVVVYERRGVLTDSSVVIDEVARLRR